MEDCLAGKPGHYIADLSYQLRNATYFDVSGSLNGRGNVKFWAELDRLVEKFDKQIETLKPVCTPGHIGDNQFVGAQHSNFRRKIDKTWKLNQQCYKLPPFPPPKEDGRNSRK